jgi:hypothetical protein
MYGRPLIFTPLLEREIDELYQKLFALKIFKELLTKHHKVFLPYILTLTDRSLSFKLSLLFPSNNISKTSHLKISIPQITISPPQEQSIITSIFSKETIFQSVSVEFHQIPSAPAAPTDQFYHSIVTAPFSSMIINPFHTNLNLTIHEEESEYSSPLLTSMQTRSYYRSVLIFKVSNLDISPNLSQLTLLQETLLHLQNSSRQYRIQLLRPKERPSRAQNNISSWWKYALIGTMVARNGDCCLFPRNNFTIGFISEVTKKQRTSYIDLYIQVLRHQNRLSGRDTTSTSDWRPPSFALTSEELKTLEDLHSQINWGSLLIFRLVAHKKFRELISTSSSEPTSSSSSLRTSTLLWSSLFSVFSTPKSSQETDPSSSAAHPTIDLETEFKIFYRDIRQSLEEISSFNHFPVDLTVVFSRFALSLDSDDRLTRSVTIIFYGCLWNFHQNFLSCDGFAHLRLGALRVFGKDGVPLISCGEYTDEWFHCYDIQSSTTRNLAFSFQYQWITQNKRPILYVFPSESNTAKPTISSTSNLHTSLTHGIKHHSILEISCNVIRIFRDSDSTQHLWNLYSSLTESYESLSLGLSTRIKRNKTNEMLIKCAQVERRNLLSSRQPSTSLDTTMPIMKWSISANLAGVIVQLPLKSPHLRASERARQRSSDSSSSSMIQLSIGFCSLYSGDFLMSLEIFKTMKTSISPTFLPATATAATGNEPPNNLFQSDSSIEYDPSQPQHQPQPQDPPEVKENRYYEGIFNGVWANRDKILQYKIRKQIGGALLQHCVCTIHNMEIQGHFPHHQAHYTEAPINFQILTTWSSPSGLSPQAPVLSIDLLSSSAHLSLKNQVFISFTF